ncbi:hypothetical protein BJ944DRAFT_269487 [Cunninghamella echinulata]|nr:hypothetical protein BJ944DRAFT_269487 [Cunninghamella echinulata]
MLSIPYEPPITSSASSSPSSSPCMSYQFLDTPLSSPLSSPHPFLLPPPSSGRSRSLSNASTSSWSSVSSNHLYSTAPSSPILYQEERRLSDPSIQLPLPPLPSSPSPSYLQHSNEQHNSNSRSYQRPQSASPSLSPHKSNVIIKRKRGRPPNTSKQIQRDHWTFVTPTVWNVKSTQLPDHLLNNHNNNDNDKGIDNNKEKEGQQHDEYYQQKEKENNNNSSNSNTTATKNGVMLVLYPQENNNINNDCHDPLDNNNNRMDIHQNLNTFTNTRMDETLTMPKKKRGRKPKTQLIGNSCFVWKDLAAKRGANRSKSMKVTKRSPSPSPLIYQSKNNNEKKEKEDEEEEAIIGWTKDLSINDATTH